MRAILYGLLASFFFAFTFVLNRSMELGGGSWAWSASLRFLFMLPMLVAIVALRGGLRTSLVHLWRHWPGYLLWSSIGFGIFYASVCFASAYGQAWLVAGTWQLVIITGLLISPFFTVTRVVDGETRILRLRIPWRAFGWSLLILLGVVLMQVQHAHSTPLGQVLLCVAPILLGAIAYPLGNRKMMILCGTEVDTFQRVLNMTLASVPFWLLLSVYGYLDSGWPSAAQTGQSLLVAIFSGVLATLLFFAATNMARHDTHHLAAVEATQAGEVLFALVGEIIFLSAPSPSPLSLAGIALIIIGIILHSIRPQRS